MPIVRMTPPVRFPLPDRRRTVTIRMEHLDPGVGVTKFYLSLGFYEDGQVGECFVNGHREGSAMQHLIADACVHISIALQCGILPEALAHSLGTVPMGAQDEDGHVPASIIGTVMAEIIASQRIEAALARGGYPAP